VTAIRFPWEDGREPAPAPTVEVPVSNFPAPAKRRGRRPSVVTAAPPGPDTTPDWRYHHLTVSGPAAPLAAFAAAARGAGVIPWQLDFGRLEEDIFHLAAAQPPARRRLSIAGCHLLARQFRGRVEARQAQAVARVGRSRACPLDLHALLPVPDAILQLGPTHPTALAWLAAQWGTQDGLRHVVLRPDANAGRRLPGGHQVVGYGFFAFGAAPDAAVAALQARWPGLSLALRTRPAG
jgi:hypothetical protein